MKKLIALATAALLSATAFASENTIHLGAYVPIFSLSVDESDFSADMLGVSGGAFLDYTHVGDSGFTFKIGAGINAVSLGGSSTVKLYGVSLDGDLTHNVFDSYVFGMNIVELGFGASFIHDELMTLSLTGNVGLADQSLAYDFDVAGYTKTVGMEMFLFYIGPEVSFTYRPVKHFGVTASMGVFYAAGSYNASIDMTGFGSRSGSVSGFIFQPKIGAAFTF